MWAAVDKRGRIIVSDSWQHSLILFDEDGELKSRYSFLMQYLQHACRKTLHG